MGGTWWIGGFILGAILSFQSRRFRSSDDNPARLYRFENSRDIVVANAGHQFSTTHFADPKAWSLVIDVDGATETATPGDEYFVHYRRK